MEYISGECCLYKVLSALTLDLSFVRSVSMDTWSEDQIKRMQVCITPSPFYAFLILLDKQSLEATAPSKTS
jgi:hypothetical protein